MVVKDLIFDVGMHHGEDSDFYLRKGFRVVGVEANPSLCEEVAVRYADAISSGRLIVVNKAIGRSDGRAVFYLNKKSIWGTLEPKWAERNNRLGSPSNQIEVEAVRPERLFAEFGVPYYLKIDIEGLDVVCLEALKHISERPVYVSLESNKTSWRELLHEFEVFANLGYKRFKVVNQCDVSKQISPAPALEGNYVAHTFSSGASGLFGEEAPGSWLSMDQALAEYRKIFRRYRFFGDEGLLTRHRLGRKLIKKVGIRNCWFDTHAAQ